MVSHVIGRNIAHAPDQPGRGPIVCGPVPPLVPGFYSRPESGLATADQLCPGEITVLADALPAEPVAADTLPPGALPAGVAPVGPEGAEGQVPAPAAVPESGSQLAAGFPGGGGAPGADAAGSGPGGGTGKTQLAAGLLRALARDRGANLLAWVSAASRDSIVTGYAQALAAAGAAVAGEPPEVAASRFLAYLAGSRRPWLVVLDDLADARLLDGLCPGGTAGRVLVTTPAAGHVLAGGIAPAAGAMPGGRTRICELGPFTRREAVNYVTATFGNDPDLRLGAPDLAAAMNCLPMALAQATAVMTDSRLDCRTYLRAFAGRRDQLAVAARISCPMPVLVSWSLAVDRAVAESPGGIAWPVLTLAACLDPAGFPGAVLTSPAASCYLTGRPASAAAAAAEQVREAVSVLARLGLLSVSPADEARTVRMHALLQRIVTSFVPPVQRDQSAWIAADALAQAWPGGDVPPPLAQSLRDNAASIRETAGELLWNGGCHPLLALAGDSLIESGLGGSAVQYWQAMVGASRRILGPEHSDTLTAGSRLAQAYRAAGRAADAVPLQERLFTDRVGALGAAHPETVHSRDDLARAYLAAGRNEDAISLRRRTVDERERTAELNHPDTLAARAELADACRAAGRHKEAIAEYERVLAGRQRLSGPDHPETIDALALLAYAYRSAGRMKHAIPAYEHTLAARERVQGPDHPDTLTARANLAAAYHSARRPRDAIREYERTLADRERVQGPDHPDTLTARANLASAYHSARRVADAIPLYEQVIADFERVMGPDHPDTLASRSNLGHAYHTAGRLADSLALFERTLADCERALGPDHPVTVTARENVAATQP
ncbi:MAG: tetratricopeptide repeat protein [Streptosporangiaceae bacterium]